MYKDSNNASNIISNTNDNITPNINVYKSSRVDDILSRVWMHISILLVQVEAQDMRFDILMRNHGEVLMPVLCAGYLDCVYGSAYNEYNSNSRC